MTSLLERTISVIAPHHCISCGKEGNILCGTCALQVFGNGVEICVLCNKPTFEARVCPSCVSHTSLRHVWMAVEYIGVAKQLVRAYKFERVRAAYKPLSLAMESVLPYLGEDIIIVHIPTALPRIRQRGYDQSKLLAREIARQRGWQHSALLRRRHNVRQVGSGRVQRFTQAAQAFELRGDISGAQVLLVDDVTTSGATLAAAAAVLAAGGAARVDAVVAAKHMLE